MTENSVTDRGKIRVATARWTERQDGRDKGRRNDSTVPTAPGCALVVAAIAVLAVIL